MLSLLLALFSIGLSALFYFKATETSNAFYDNSFKYTKDIAELLVRIESGFGERLRHLDEGYNAISNRVSNLPTGVLVQDAQQEIKETEKRYVEVQAARDKMIEELAAKAALQEEEMRRFVEQLKYKEEEIDETKAELLVLNKRLASLLEATNNKYENRGKMITGSVVAENNVPNIMKKESLSLIKKIVGSAKFNTLEFSELLSEIKSTLCSGNVHEKYLEMLRYHNVIDDGGNLTSYGVHIIADLKRVTASW
ncbi:hypothetical protein DSECCO2_578870 [anaerobic digester metagenome]